MGQDAQIAYFLQIRSSRVIRPVICLEDTYNKLACFTV